MSYAGHMFQSTPIPTAATVVMVVGGDAVLAAATRSAVDAAFAARVEHVTVATVATAVSTYRPIAIVMSHDVYGFDAKEFDALARDVGAAVIPVDCSLDQKHMERRLVPKFGRLGRGCG